MAIDSFKIRAQNSLKNNFNQKKIDRHIDHIDTKINEYQNQLDQEDEQEGILQKIEHQNKKKKIINRLKNS